MNRPARGCGTREGALRMPFTHFRGGLKPPLRRGGFTVNGFIPPVDALRHVRSRKPFRICSSEKRARNSPLICTHKSLDLNCPGINSYKKHRGGTPSWPGRAASGPDGMLHSPAYAHDAHPPGVLLLRENPPARPFAEPVQRLRRSEERRVGKECRL